MFEFVNYGAEKLQFLILIIVRISGMFALAPVLGERGLPTFVRIALVLLLSLVLLPVLPSQGVGTADSFWQLGGLVLHELLIGFLIGLLYRLLFWGTITAGGIIGYQLGFAMVTVYDQNLSSQVSIIGRFWYALAILIFISINGHHTIISAFADSYSLVPAGVFGISSDVGEMIIRLTAFVFIVALKIAAPMIITLFLTDIALGTIAKTMPTMNVFFVGFPLKISIGLIVLAISLPVFAFVLERTTGYFDQQLRILLNGVAGA